MATWAGCECGRLGVFGGRGAPRAPARGVSVARGVAVRATNIDRVSEENSSSSSSGSSSGRPSTSSSSLGLKLKRAKISDATAVASLCAEVFAADTTEGMTEAAPALSGWLAFIARWYESSIKKELAFQLKKALEGKTVATREAQAFKLRYKVLDGKSLGFASTAAAKNLRRLIATKDMQRRFNVFFLENEQGEVVASVAASMTITDPKLPPPFPAKGLPRFYLGNMVVREDYRRKGIATDLLRECETLARRWKCDSIWLHVGVASPGAQKLYQNLGYKEKEKDPWYMILEKRYLYSKTLELPKGSKFQRMN